MYESHPRIRKKNESHFSAKVWPIKLLKTSDIMSEEIIEAVLEGKEVIVPLQKDAELLYQGGYGNLREKEQGSTLGSCEALYLVAEKRLHVVDSKDSKELNFTAVFDKLRSVDAETWTRYLIYRDLRSRGYVVRDGFGFGIDFRLYERGKYGEQAAKYIVFGIREGNPIPISKLDEVLHFVQSTKKELILAVVDRRGEIVYYSLSKLTF